MGNWTLIVQGTGAHHYFKELGPNRPIPDGEDDYERYCNDADYQQPGLSATLK